MSPCRILVVQTAFLGDVILTLPLVRQLHADDPTAEITLAVRPGLAELVTRQPGIASILSVSKRRGLLRRLGHDRGILGKLRRARFDAAYLAQRSFRSGLYAWISAADRRVGFSGSPSSWACTDRVPYAHDMPAADRILSLAGGHGELPATPRFELDEQSRAAGDAVLRANGIEPSARFLALAPGSVWPTKRWTTAGYAGVLHWAAGRGLKTMILGTDDERELGDELVRDAGGLAINLCGKTNLTALPAILERSQLLIGNDSGPGHLAAAVGTPVVTVFGPTTPEQGFRPVGERVLSVGLESGLDCRPCSRHGGRRCPLKHHRCMQDLTASAVLDKIENWELNPLRDKRQALRG